MMRFIGKATVRQLPLSRLRVGTSLAGLSSTEPGCVMMEDINQQNMGRFVALREADGRTYIVPFIDEEIKIKGIGRFRPSEILSDTTNGSRITVGQKIFTRVEPGLPELRKGMKRRAQIINPKDAGFLLAWMGIGSGQRILEAGHGSGGLALHLANVLGENGLLISIENRQEHAIVGQENMLRAAGCLPEFPTWTLLEGDICNEKIVNSILDVVEELDAIILDLPEPWLAIPHLKPLLRNGGRLACYCPVSSQFERCWDICEEVGLEIDWAGEMMERTWTKASLGGVRPGNTPMGHTAFLLISEKSS